MTEFYIRLPLKNSWWEI